MDDCNKQNIDHFYEVALNLTKDAGRIIQENFYSRSKDVKTKTSAIDFVTEYDQKVETFLKENLLKHFPTHKFIGEESVSDGAKCELTEEPTWIIDPIDGTTNFIHSFPHACISVCLFIHKTPQIGIIYNPLLNQLFTAKKGNGTFLNGESIKTSNTISLADALVIAEYVQPRNPDSAKAILENSKFLMKNCHGVRTLGSAALDISMVASGGADAFFAFGIHIWDFAAGELLVTEAGGVVMDPAGGEIDRLSRRFLVASTKELAESLANNLTQLYPKERD